MTNEINRQSSITLLSVCQSACIRSHWCSDEQRSCTVMLMSMALCVWTAASGSALWWACTSLLHRVCLEARASVSERVYARLPSQSVDSWKSAELRDTANFRISFVCVCVCACLFCFDVLRANCWNILFVNARGGHSPLHVFISFLIRTASFYI